MTRGGACLLGAALASLLLGAAVYLVARPTGTVLFISPLYGSVTGIFGAAGDWLPSLTHAFAFTLLSAFALGLSRGAVVTSCVLWAGLELAFELGQHPVVSQGLESVNLGMNYFRYGTYDPHDLIASLGGVLLAFLLILFLRKHHAQGR